jgi:hypothetical protein
MFLVLSCSSVIFAIEKIQDAINLIIFIFYLVIEIIVKQNQYEILDLRFFQINETLQK